ncbi:hypothetical protein SSAG_04104 [Streptomyces sp. Mg1]|nr:hypothetical protein SSAG_04104 [Streptomyces sp. Mg1]
MTSPWGAATHWPPAGCGATMEEARSDRRPCAATVTANMPVVSLPRAPGRELRRAIPQVYEGYSGP